MKDRKMLHIDMNEIENKNFDLLENDKDCMKSIPFQLSQDTNLETKSNNICLNNGDLKLINLNNEVYKDIKVCKEKLEINDDSKNCIFNEKPRIFKGMELFLFKEAQKQVSGKYSDEEMNEFKKRLIMNREKDERMKEYCRRKKKRIYTEGEMFSRKKKNLKKRLERRNLKRLVLKKENKSKQKVKVGCVKLQETLLKQQIREKLFNIVDDKLVLYQITNNLSGSLSSQILNITKCKFLYRLLT